MLQGQAYTRLGVAILSALILFHTAAWSADESSFAAIDKLVENQNYPEALAALEKILRGGEDKAARERRTRIFDRVLQKHVFDNRMAAGRASMKLKQYDDAIRHFEAARKVPGHAEDADAAKELSAARAARDRAHPPIRAEEYDNQLAVLETLLKSIASRGGADNWRQIESRAKALCACGADDTSRAQAILMEARSHLRLIVFRQWPFAAKEARWRRRQAAKVLEMKESRKVNLAADVALQLALIPPGEIRKDGKAEWIEHPMFAGAHEVTIGQFEAFVKATKYVPLAKRLGGVLVHLKPWRRDPEVTWLITPFEQSKRAPVTGLSWADAEAFCAWLDMTDRHRPVGWAYRLPTELEWEYIARAGTDDAFHGASIKDLGWSASNRTMRGPYAVGEYTPNAWGLYDVHGNVWEWCADGRGKAFANHTLKGGSWTSTANDCRFAKYEIEHGAERLRTDTGFRVILAPVQEATGLNKPDAPE